VLASRPVKTGRRRQVDDSALQHHSALTDLWRSHLRNKGRYGSPRARRLLQAESDGARSEAERPSPPDTAWDVSRDGVRTIQSAHTRSTSRSRMKIRHRGRRWAFHSDQEGFNEIESARTTSLCGLAGVRFFFFFDVAGPRRDPQRVIAVIGLRFRALSTLRATVAREIACVRRRLRAA